MKGRNRLTFDWILPGVLPHVSREVWIVPLFTLLTALGALIRVHLPGTPVPATLQTLFVLVSGGVGGAIAGPASQVLYIALGFCGLPFFAGPVAGGASFLSPTFGYLGGFVVASAFMGIVGGKSTSTWLWILKGAAATVIIYVCGITYLSVYTGGDIGSAALIGIAPFVPWDIMKVVAAALLITRFTKRKEVK